MIRLKFVRVTQPKEVNMSIVVRDWKRWTSNSQPKLKKASKDNFSSPQRSPCHHFLWFVICPCRSISNTPKFQLRHVDCHHFLHVAVNFRIVALHLIFDEEKHMKKKNKMHSKLSKSLNSIFEIMLENPTQILDVFLWCWVNKWKSSFVKSEWFYGHFAWFLRLFSTSASVVSSSLHFEHTLETYCRLFYLWHKSHEHPTSYGLQFISRELLFFVCACFFFFCFVHITCVFGWVVLFRFSSLKRLLQMRWNERGEDGMERNGERIVGWNHKHNVILRWNPFKNAITLM